MDVRHGTRVTRVERVGDDLPGDDQPRDGSRADSVVVATGGEQHPRTPDVARALDPGIRQLHSSGYHNPSQLLPGPVLVVGAGQSGADIALELARAGHETWLSGKPSGEVPVDIESPAQPDRRAGALLPGQPRAHRAHADGPADEAAGALGRRSAGPREAARTSPPPGCSTWRRAPRAARDGRPELADGTVLDVANVVWCTGFRQDFSFIHPSVVGEDGWPRDEGGVVPELPGPLLHGPAVPARLLLDADRRRPPGRALHRRPDPAAGARPTLTGAPLLPH